MKGNFPAIKTLEKEWGEEFIRNYFSPQSTEEYIKRARSVMNQREASRKWQANHKVAVNLADRIRNWRRKIKEDIGRAYTFFGWCDD